MKKLVVFSGAGISAESGLKTFRDSDGLWENYKVQDVATPGAWQKDPALVQGFYNARRKQSEDAKPNKAHCAIAELESHFDVHVITQNIDNLHERGGSSKVLHLHGEIGKARSSVDPELILPVKGADLNMGDLCPKGSQLRPHIVWFGEEVPMLDEAAEVISGADIVLIVGSSLVVYPAASLIHYAPEAAAKYLVDPSAVQVDGVSKLQVVVEKATIGVPMVASLLVNQLTNS